jgi:hypothetical protein
MRMGVLLVLIGEIVVLGSLLLLAYSVIWLSFIHFTVVAHEESHLARAFGPRTHTTAFAFGGACRPKAETIERHFFATRQTSSAVTADRRQDWR